MKNSQNIVKKETESTVEYSTSYITEIRDILASARNKAYYAINSAMVEAYWQIGRRIVEEEQQGKERADYGTYIVKTLSKELTTEFGKGFSERSIWQFRQFYQMFPDFEIMRTPLAQFQNVDNNQNTIMRTLSAHSELSLHLQKLNWAQIQRIMRVSNPDARTYYIKETAENMWSYRTTRQKYFNPLLSTFTFVSNKRTCYCRNERQNKRISTR